MPDILIPPLNSFDSLLRARAQALPELRDTIDALYQRGWALGTSGNFSTVLSRSPLRLLITASGRDKARLGADDFVIVDSEGRSVESGISSNCPPSQRDAQAPPSTRLATQTSAAPKPSAETLLHVVLAQRHGAGAVLHTHSIWNTLLSDHHFAAGAVPIRGYEMLKGLAGITTHDCEVQIPIFDNTQNIPTLAGSVAQHLQRRGPTAPPAFLIRGHGLYAWGCDLAEARRHVEVLEFLFEVLGRKRSD